MCVNQTFVYVERGWRWEKIPKACGVCWQCKLFRVNDYVGRALCEASVSDWTVALTLTYAPRDDLADKVLTPRHFQSFIRAMRKTYPLRYLVAGEYGSLKGRSHFHCILFGRGVNRPQIPHREKYTLGPVSSGPKAKSPWPHGHVFADWSADAKSLRYVCKYLLKDTDRRQSWFSLSKKPPLGSAFFEERAAEYARLGAFPTSFEYKPPGGDGAQFFMTGATRRYFLLRLLRQDMPVDQLNEWVRLAFEKVDRWQFRKLCEEASREAGWSERQWQKLLADYNDAEVDKVPLHLDRLAQVASEGEF